MNQMPHRYTKKEIKAYVLSCVASSYNIAVNDSNVVTLTESPALLRHSCFKTGIAVLNKNSTVVQQPDFLQEVSYYVCTICGKVYICYGDE
jgi:hypothetical protein